MATILVLGVKVPFTTGGQNVLVGSLVQELRGRGHDVDTVEMPFNPKTREDLLHYAAVWRSIDLTSFGGRGVDLVIATQYPTYYARHPRKSVWLVHQCRSAYELFGTRFSDFSDDPRDEAVRRMIYEGDVAALSESAVVAAISANVARRAAELSGVAASVLHPPLPLAGRYRCEEPADPPYVLSVGRICSIKRVDLMVKALPHVRRPVKLLVAGRADEEGVMSYLRNETAKHHLADRVEFLGRVDDDRLVDLYARALAVYYAPHDEDYGYVTLEAFASGKPVVTAADSGGVLDFARDGENALVAAPDPESVGAACDRLAADPGLAGALGRRGKASLGPDVTGVAGWDAVTETLLSPLAGGGGLRGVGRPAAAPTPEAGPAAAAEGAA